MGLVRSSDALAVSQLALDRPADAAANLERAVALVGACVGQMEASLLGLAVAVVVAQAVVELATRRRLAPVLDIARLERVELTTPQPERSPEMPAQEDRP